MLDYHPTINLQKISKINNWNSQPSVLSARPKIQYLPFLNNLKQIRKLLVNIKNQKLRKSLYSANRQKQILQNKFTQSYTHEKAKLSVMDLISQQGKFQQLQNTIQNNLLKKSSQISQHIITETYDDKLEFMQKKLILQTQQQQEKLFQKENKAKQSKNQPDKKPSILDKKNQLAQDLNKLGHQLQQTYFQVQELQKVFQLLCNFYSNNRAAMDQNLKMKQKRELIKQKIQQFQMKINNNQSKIDQIEHKKLQYIEWYKNTISQYIQSAIQYNSQLFKINEHIYQQHKQSLGKSINQQKLYPQQYRQSQQQSLNQQPLKINLKFKMIKQQLQKIKLQKKNSLKQKNKQKKNKLESNNLTKFYASEVYTL